MRTTPLIGEKVWFAPRRLGWGLDPVSPEGWAVTLLAVLVSVTSKRTHGTTRSGARVLLGILIILMVLKGSTPGGRHARRAFNEARAEPATDTP